MSTIICTGIRSVTECFLDTSFFIALLSQGDEHHAKAERIAAQSLDDQVTTAWVLTEVGSYFSRSQSRALFVELIALLRQNERIHVVPADERSFDAGFALFAARPDKNWSLVDCISFAVMIERNITDALTADHHFEQAGFRVLLK